LVAYVKPAAGRRAGGPAELRAFLRRTLPDFMIPAAFVELPSLPLLPNGKVDRAALPAPESARGAAAGVVEPRNELERTIAAVLREALRVDRVGIDENFFDLGGHSLSMIRAAGTLERLLDRKLPVLELFRFPTVAALAAHLSGGETPAAAIAAAEQAGAEPVGAGAGQPGRQLGRQRRREARREPERVVR
jgi:acyl carrier protein